MFYDEILAQLNDVTTLSTIVRLFLAALFGGIVGMERGRRRRAAGMRTHMLVCMGAALAMITNQYIASQFELTDPSRMGAQVISGIGFLGVGTIIVDRQQQVKGLTTAAGLWACACMGLAVGIGFYQGAIVACIFILLAIVLVNRFERRVSSKSRHLEVYAEFKDYSDINYFTSKIVENGVRVIEVEIVVPREYVNTEKTGIAAIMVLRLPKRHLHTEVISTFESVSGVLCINELRQ